MPLRCLCQYIREYFQVTWLSLNHALFYSSEDIHSFFLLTFWLMRLQHVTAVLLRLEDALDLRNFHLHLWEEKEKLSSTWRDLLTDSITDSLKLREIFIVGHECKLPVGADIFAILIIFKRVGVNLNWKFLLSRPAWSHRIITDHQTQNVVH